jgi:hypothetical protein
MWSSNLHNKKNKNQCNFKLNKFHEYLCTKFTTHGSNIEMGAQLPLYNTLYITMGMTSLWFFLKSSMWESQNDQIYRNL